MLNLPEGRYEIQCVLIDHETVLNNEGIQSLEVDHSGLVIQPSGQRFIVTRSYRKTAMLMSNGHAYVAEYRNMDEKGTVLIDLKRERVMQTISIEAKLVQVSVSV